MARKVQSESKRGLVVTLVFFILTTIGAGVAAYYGFSEQAKLKKAADDEKTKAGVIDKQREWYALNLAVALSYLDAAPEATSEIGKALARRADFDAGTFPPAAVANLESTKAEAAALKTLRTKLGALAAWKNDAAKPDNTLPNIIDTQGKEITRLKGELVKAQELAAKEKDLRVTAEANRAKDQTNFEANLKSQAATFAADLETAKQDYKKLDEKFKKVEDNKYAELIKPIEEKNAQLEGDNKKLVKENKELNARVKDLSDRYVKRDEETVKPSELKPVGEIVRVHANSRKATINLGKTQGLKPQTTFEVFGYQSNGKLKSRSKASIEVVTVGETQSDVFVTGMYAPDDTGNPQTGLRKKLDVLSQDNVDPIKRGDALVSRIFAPNKKTHIAIAGMIDFTGSGAVSLQSFIQMLERQGVIIDAYVNPADGEIVGKVNRNTEFVLLGNKPTGREPGTPRDAATLEKIAKNMDELLKEANANAIPRIQPRRFLEETGFNLPKNVVTD